MKIAVIDFPGSNSSAEVVRVLEHLGQEGFLLNYRADSLKEAKVIIIPGGFAFGDYLRPGALAKGTPVAGIIRRFATDGGPVMGIGNGFQILTELGLLPGALLQNPTMDFCNREVLVRVDSNKSLFTKNIPIGTKLRLPMGCYFGRYYTDRRTINDLDNYNHIALRYCDDFGEVDLYKPFLESLRSVAGVISRHENVLGIMPRAERAVDALLGSTDGLKFFESMIQG